MPTAGIVYTQALGDIIGTIPISYYLYKNGYKIQHFCIDQYADIFKSVSYIEAVIVPGGYSNKKTYETALKLSANCDLIVDRQIWPKRYNEWRNSTKTWLEFVFLNYPTLISEPAKFDLDFNLDHLVDRNKIGRAHV